MLRTKDQGIEHVGLTGYKAASLAARFVPEPLMAGVATVMGFASAQTMRQRRAVVARNLQRIDPSLRGVRLEQAVRATFDSYARYWIESFRVPHLSREEVDNGFAMQGYGQIPLALEQGKGAILALPHLGGWEWAGRWLVDRGHRMMAVVEPIEPPELFDWFVSFRESLGMRIVGLGPGAGSEVVKALQDNQVVCLVCDRDILGGGIEVEFFGETTTVPAGPVTMALRTGAPVFPTAVFFGGERGHIGVVRPALDLTRTGRLRDDVARLTQDSAAELEVLIRRAPEQGHLLQPNWPSDADLAE